MWNVKWRDGKGKNGEASRKNNKDSHDTEGRET